MPQLNPTPWFLMLLFSWLVFLMIPQKIMKHHFSTDPSTSNAKEQTSPWTWPWH
uniref:ATP synthase complex subunit 8 n=1 Tax=Pantodon buchholzi TaxID=8276 RepID=Q94YP1_PANBU|nr:ATP synthase F0 subunit 8 [Pantodon buchholzi]BAB64394.1 ATPase subunits 8 [Pantodon buchholzi]